MQFWTALSPIPSNTWGSDLRAHKGGRPVSLEAHSCGDGHELRIDVCCRSIVIAGFGVDAVRRVAHAEGKTAACISAAHGGSGAGQGLAGGDESAGTVEPPPEPGRSTGR